MDSFVVHIFRRPSEGSNALVGLVERIGQGDRKVFHDQAQLLEYLMWERRSSVGERRGAEKKT